MALCISKYTHSEISQQISICEKGWKFTNLILYYTKDHKLIRFLSETIPNQMNKNKLQHNDKQQTLPHYMCIPQFQKF